jgi:hypothetical protein
MMAQQDGDWDRALFHLQKIDSFFSVIPQAGYMNTMIQHQMARVYFERGELAKAKQALARSDSICIRDDIRLTPIANMRLRSEILNIEGKIPESLLAFKIYSSRLDSILGAYQVQNLTNMLMQILFDENGQNQPPTGILQRKEFYVPLIVLMLIGIAILYRFRDAFISVKGKYQQLLHLSKQASQVGLSPELKQHFCVMMMEYRKGLEHYMNHIRNNGGKPEDYQNFNRQMDETDEYIGKFKKWLDMQPFYSNPPSKFEARQFIGVIVRMLEVVFQSKQLNIQNRIEDDITVYGVPIYFCIALEIMLFRVMQKSELNDAIILSAQDGDKFITFSLIFPDFIMSEEIRATTRHLIQKMQATHKTVIFPQTRAEICLKCIYENNGNLSFESTPEKGTVINFTVPKENNLEQSW